VKEKYAVSHPRGPHNNNFLQEKLWTTSLWALGL